MNNEEKILELLSSLGKQQDEQSRLLQRQGVIMEQLLNSQLKSDMKIQEQGVKLNSIQKDLSETKTLSKRTAVLLETDYHDKLQLLFDGHSSIMEKLNGLTPKDRADALEDEVGFLRSVVKSMNKRIDELEKAQ